MTMMNDLSQAEIDALLAGAGGGDSSDNNSSGGGDAPAPEPEGEDYSGLLSDLERTRSAK